MVFIEEDKPDIGPLAPLLEMDALGDCFQKRIFFMDIVVALDQARKNICISAASPPILFLKAIEHWIDAESISHTLLIFLLLIVF